MSLDAVEVVEVVEDPQRVDSGDLGLVALLPINPPEIETLLLKELGT